MSKFVTVQFPDSPSEPTQVYKFCLYQGVYEHEYATMSFRDWNVSAARVKAGTAIRVTLGAREFVGYVHDIKTDVDGARNFVQVNAIGASYVMRQPSQAVYKNVTSTELVKKIATKHGFSYNIDPYPRVYPHIAQAGLSDWELLVKLAKQAGYFLIVEGTSLGFKPINKDFEDFALEAPIFSKNEFGIKSENALYAFTPRIGETLDYPLANKAATAVSGIDPVTGEPFKVVNKTRPKTTRRVSQTELFDRYATKVVAPSYEIAQFEAISVDERSRFPYVAEVEVTGTATLRPGFPVYLDNLGTYSGYWTVLRTEHEVIEDTKNVQVYTTKLHVGTDSLGDTAIPTMPNRPPAAPIRLIKPNVRQTRIKPANVVKSTGIKVKPVSEVTLVKSNNRLPKQAKPHEAVSSTWSSNTGNLKAKKAEPRRSPIVVEKVLKRGR